MKKKQKQTVKKEKSFKDYLVFLLIAFTMIFLTSSFVVENVYNYADRIATTPEGVAEIYEINIGQREKPEASSQTVEEQVFEETDVETEQEDAAAQESQAQTQPAPSADANKQ